MGCFGSQNLEAVWSRLPALWTVIDYVQIFTAKFYSKNLETLGPSRRRRGWPLRNTALSTCYSAKFGRCRSNDASV